MPVKDLVPSISDCIFGFNKQGNLLATNSASIERLALANSPNIEVSIFPCREHAA